MGVELRPFGVACNISCSYCYQNPQREAGNFRQPYDLDRMKAAVEKHAAPFTLFGGEPLLIPLDDLEELFRWGMEKYGRTGIQTNGVLIGDDHLRLFKAYNVDVGVSVDGPGELNDLRWHINLNETRRATALTLASIERLCREHEPPGLIVTLHRLNAAPDRLPRLHAWVREMDALGIRSMRLHLLESESDLIRRTCGLSDEQNADALLSFADLQADMKNLQFDVIGEMERSLLGNDSYSSCVWRSCDPYTTEAVQGIEGNGQSSNCGRTNKDGVDFIKSERRGFERYIALYNTPQEAGGCKGCRFFIMCRGQCPGTAIDGDWRNRSELCGVWKRVFIHLEKKLILQGRVPLSVHPVRSRLEQRLLEGWADARNSTIQELDWAAPQAASPNAAPGADQSRDTHAASARFPRFVRHTFVGEAQRARWSPRITAVQSALARLSVLAVARGLVPASLAVAAPCEVFELHNLAAGYDLHALLLSGRSPDNRQPMIIGPHEIAESFKRAWEASDAAAMDELTGIPDCCRRSNEAFRKAGLIDPLWPIARSDQKPSAATIDVRCRPIMNTLLRRVGIAALDHLPCSFDCEPSYEMAAARLSLGRQSGLKQEVAWLEAMLDWPAEWSALHAIAEVKTAIVKIAYDTDYTAEKVAIRYHGRALAEDAARGLTFAYSSGSGGCQSHTGRK